jgi:hypothetical protein
MYTPPFAFCADIIQHFCSNVNTITPLDACFAFYAIFLHIIHFYLPFIRLLIGRSARDCPFVTGFDLTGIFIGKSGQPTFTVPDLPHF